MAEEMDTQNPAPNDGSADSVGHASDATQDTSQGVVEQPTTPSGDTEQASTEATAPKYRYLGKKFADVHELENAYYNAQRKITEQGQGRVVQPDYVPTEFQDTVEQPSVAEQQLRALQQQVTATNLRLAQAEEEKILDEVVEAHPALSQARDLMKAFWRQNPNTPAEDVVARFEKLISLGRNESKEDLLKKKNNAVETGKGSTEAPVRADGNMSKFARAAEHSGKSRTANIDLWADAIPDDLIK